MIKNIIIQLYQFPYYMNLSNKFKINIFFRHTEDHHEKASKKREILRMTF